MWLVVLKGFITWLLVFCPARSEDSGQEMQSIVNLVLTPSLFLGYVMGPTSVWTPREGTETPVAS